MKIYIDFKNQVITKTSNENVMLGDIYSNVFELLFYNFDTDTNWFPTLSQLAPNGRSAGDFSADALGIGETHNYTEDGVNYLKYDFTIGDGYVNMSGRSMFYIWVNRTTPVMSRKGIAKVNVNIDASTDTPFITDPLFNPAVKTYIDACVTQLASGSPKVFDTEYNIEHMQDDEGIAVATDTGYIYVFNDTQREYQNTGVKYAFDSSPSLFETTTQIQNETTDKGLAVATDTGYIWVWSTSAQEYQNSNYKFIADVSLFYTKTESDGKFAPKTTAITHTGNQLQDYSGNDIYPVLDDGQIAEAKLSSALKLKVIKDYVTPEMFGAKGDGVTDDTTAIQNALIECETKKIPLFLINTYAISSTIKVTFNKSRIEGLTSNARIIQTDGSKDILVYERTYQNDFSNIVLKNLTLTYSTYGNTDTAGIRFSQVGTPDLFGTHDSIIENVTIGRAYYGIYAGTQEPLWNINFNRITMTKIIYCAMFLGNGFGNDIQLMVKDATANPNVTRGVAFQCSAGCLIDFDIEDWTGVLFKDESAFSPIRFSKIHIERCTLEANYGAFINISNTQTTIEEILIYKCTVNSTNFGNAIKYYGASITGTASLIVNQAKSSDITFGTNGAKFSLITTIGNGVNFVSVLGCTGFDYVYYPYDTVTSNCYYKYTAR